MTYVAKDYWMICDRCGGRFRHSDMKEEWTGLWVCTRGCWETQHPQDFVEGVADDPSVAIARPDVPNAYGQTLLSAEGVLLDQEEEPILDERETAIGGVGGASQWATSFTLDSVTGLEENDPIGITLDNGVVHWTFLTADPVGNVVTINDGLPWAAAEDNIVYKHSVDYETWV